MDIVRLGFDDFDGSREPNELAEEREPNFSLDSLLDDELFDSECVE